MYRENVVRIAVQGHRTARFWVKDYEAPTRPRQSMKDMLNTLLGAQWLTPEGPFGGALVVSAGSGARAATQSDSGAESDSDGGAGGVEEPVVSEPIIGECRACLRQGRTLGDYKSGFRCKGECLSAYRKIKHLLSAKQPLGQKYSGDNSRRPGQKLDETIRIKLQREPAFFQSVAWLSGKPRSKLEALLGEDADAFLAKCPMKSGWSPAICKS